MRSRPFPALKQDVSELALGTWGLSGDAYGPVSAAECDAVIDRALELGVTLFDTADAYAQGEMQRRLGRRLSGASSSTSIATRIGTDLSGDHPRKCFAPTFLREAVEKSLDRVGRSRLDICLLHNPNLSTIQQSEATDLMRELKDSGFIGAWGVSAATHEVAQAALDAGAEVLSLAYNVFRSKDLHAIAGEVARRGVTVLAHSVLAYGLLCGNWAKERIFEEGDHRRDRWTAFEFSRRIDQLDVVRDMLGGDVSTPRSAALRFVLCNSLVTSAIVGPRSTAQLDQLVRDAGQGPPYLPDKVLATLPRRLLAVGIST